MEVREKLVELLWEYDQMRMMRMSIEECADRIMEKGVTVQEWISVKDRLPEKPGKYLVYGRCFGNKAPQIWICECICIGSVKGWCNNAKNPVVEAWTTLPQPPKGE